MDYKDFCFIVGIGIALWTSYIILVGRFSYPTNHGTEVYTRADNPFMYYLSVLSMIAIAAILFFVAFDIHEKIETFNKPETVWAIALILLILGCFGWGVHALKNGYVNLGKGGGSNYDTYTKEDNPIAFYFAVIVMFSFGFFCLYVFVGIFLLS
ncbi:hypothetical protein [Spartinivicinus poritis]|uniref:Uncharacterized protein n=1 Tax=Spartinivicinus poritis TaxID=2994640 RepID=A0ABT5UHK7_9GAMM|nr:hypothetical protein [Spartinivicinus sp. A2-2]MDE1465881.1 hypothetical protein [Spartinivicinus sp. A2-2]